MTTYNPRNNAIKSFINKIFLQQFYYLDKDIDTKCRCGVPQHKNEKQGWSYPSQTENTRIAQTVKNSLGGRITFGNSYKPVTLNYMGGWEGQPGGVSKPLRNKF